jgi:hypothetical protein
MALSEQKLQQAKDEAKRYLEYSTFVCAILLGVDPDTIEYPYVVEDGVVMDLPIHQSLSAQVSALEKLK